MITPEEFLVRWGEDDFLRYSPDVVSILNIPESSKQFLLYIGLPKQDRGFIAYVTIRTMPPLSEYLSSVSLPPDCAFYRLLAEKQFLVREQACQAMYPNQSRFPEHWPNRVYSRCYICLDEQESGRVVLVSDDHEDYSVYLLNTSYEKFLEMQLFLREEAQWLNSWESSYYFDHPKRYSEEFYQHGREMISAFRDIDPKAIEAWTDVFADLHEPYS